MFQSNKRKYILNFLENHPDLTENEKRLITDTANKLSNPKVSQYQELTSITHSLQKLSLNSQLSKDGFLLLQKLHRSNWFFGILYSFNSFGH